MSEAGEEFLAYCLDLTTWLVGTSNYSLTDTPWSFNNLVTSGAVARIQNIYDANYHLVNSRNTSAAFQLLLWNAIYDDDYDLTAGAFQAHSTTAAVDTAAVTFGANALGYAGDVSWEACVL